MVGDVAGIVSCFFLIHSCLCRTYVDILVVVGCGEKRKGERRQEIKFYRRYGAVASDSGALIAGSMRSVCWTEHVISILSYVLRLD